MRARWTSTLIIIAILLPGAVVARGQEVAKNTNSIAELKEQIARLTSIERDESISAEVKSINHNFLEERRGQLRTLLQRRRDALQNYRSSVGSALTAKEIAVVDKSISDLEKDLQGMQADVSLLTTNTSSMSLSASKEDGSLGVAAPEPPTMFTGRLIPSAPAPVQNTAAVRTAGGFVPRGSDPGPDTDPDPDPNKGNVFRKAVIAELANLKNEVINTPRKLASQTLTQARMEAFDFTANPMLFALLLTNRMLPRDEFIKDLEAARIDKQTGGSDTNAGSTTLVSKGGIPAVIGFAVEHGGLTSNVDGNTVTFRGNPVGLVEAFQKTGFIPSYKDSESTRLLRKLSFSVSFDTSQGSTPGTFLASRQQLSSYSFRYEFKNDRDPRNEKYRKGWEKMVKDHAQQVANILGRNQRVLTTQPAYVTWLESAQKAIGKATDDGVSNADMDKVIDQQLEAFQAIEVPPSLAQFIESFQTEFAAYRQDRDKLLDIVANAPIFTLEYVNNRRPGLIDTSTLNFIAETGMFEGKADLTYNGTVTFFNSSPGAGMKRIRNFDNSLRLDLPIGDPRRFSGVLTFAGKYKRLMEDDMTSGGTAMSIKGDMATGQLLFTIPIKGSGFKIPISFTFANRTEFVKEKEVRGNFGFTFDLDSILQRVKPF